MGYVLAAQKRLVKIIDVKMDYVEQMGPLKNLLHFQHLVNKVIVAITIETKRLSAGRNQFRFGQRIAAGEERDLVALIDQFFG